MDKGILFVRVVANDGRGVRLVPVGGGGGGAYDDAGGGGAGDDAGGGGAAHDAGGEESESQSESESESKFGSDIEWVELDNKPEAGDGWEEVIDCEPADYHCGEHEHLAEFKRKSDKNGKTFTTCLCTYNLGYVLFMPLRRCGRVCACCVFVLLLFCVCVCSPVPTAVTSSRNRPTTPASSTRAMSTAFIGRGEQHWENCDLEFGDYTGLHFVRLVDDNGDAVKAVQCDYYR
jgi:hypothetical protein